VFKDHAIVKSNILILVDNAVNNASGAGLTYFSIINLLIYLSIYLSINLSIYNLLFLKGKLRIIEYHLNI